jgi:hypothetical protein
MPILLPVYANFDRALPKIKCYLSSLKGPNFPLALYTNAYLLMCLPRYPFDMLGFCWQHMASLFTGYFTNVIASKQEYQYNGKKQLGIFVSAPIISETGLSIALLSSGKTLGFSVFTDVTRMEKPEEFVEIVKQINRE